MAGDAEAVRAQLVRLAYEFNLMLEAAQMFGIIVTVDVVDDEDADRTKLVLCFPQDKPQ